MTDITWFLTSISLLGTVLNIRKNIWCFYVWLIGDILWCVFDFNTDTYGRSLLDFVQVILSVCGIISWKAKLKKEVENLQIEKINISKLNPAKYNPRKDLKPGDIEYEKLKRSIDEFGYVEPIIWNKKTGNIIGGHQRYKILKKMGLSESGLRSG